MSETIIELSERGQLTVPKKIRDNISGNKFVCRLEDGNIILEPLQTINEFWSQLDKAELDWKKNGGLTLKEIKRKYKL